MPRQKSSWAINLLIPGGIQSNKLIRHILLDLDNTLYSVRYGIEDVLFSRVREFTASYLKISLEKAVPLQKEGYKRWGSSIRWLMEEKGFRDKDAYFAYLHPEDEVDMLTPNAALGEFLKALPCPCSILTNAPGFHADRVLKKLELEGIFLNVFDILGNDLKGKPDPFSYNRALSVIGHKASDVLFVDDMPHYAEAFIKLGGRGILIDELDTHKDYQHEKIKNLFEIKQILLPLS